MTAKPSRRYNSEQYKNLHKSDALYFSGNYEHNLVCGVPNINNKAIIEKCMLEYISKADFRYSKVDGHPIYRKEIEKILKAEQCEHLSFIATAGGTGGILLSMMSIIDSDDEVILIDPDFSAYRYLTQLLGASPVFYELKGNFNISIDEIRRLITRKTKAIIFSNPSNPLGTVANKKVLQEMVDLAEENGIWVIVDEVYSEFTFSHTFDSILSIKSENVISVRSLSKSGGLGGWRIGYAVGSEKIISIMRDVQEYSFICPSVSSQLVAAGILPETQFLIKDVLDSVKDACELLKQNDVEFIQPQATFFICVIAPNKSGIEFTERCYDGGVAVLPGVLFSRRDNFIRLSLAGEKEKNLNAIKRFIEIYSEVKNENKTNS